MSKEKIHSFLTKDIRNLKVLVIGDIMLDRYMHGKVERISPEAPVPINHVQSERAALGGAANVALNLKRLGSQPCLVGVVGDDIFAKEIETLLREASLNYSFSVDNERRTTTKVRLMDATQQMMRLDFEDTDDISGSVEEKLLEILKEKISDGYDGIILSDYKKGLFTNGVTRKIISLAKNRNIPLFIDPKGSEWEKYEGADFITPNVKEISLFLNQTISNDNASIVKAAQEVMEDCHIKNILVTRSEKGLTLVNEKGIWHGPAIAQDVFDVCGAGDAVVAMITLAILSGLSMREALWLANTAASVVVSHLGAYPVSLEEVYKKWEDYTDEISFPDKITSREVLEKVIDKWQSRGETVAFTNGCFDILHRGHVEYLRKAASLADHLIIGVNSDRSVRALKGPERPINHEDDRAFLLANLAFVDGVTIFDEDTPYELLCQLEPNILVKGGDYRAEDVVGRELVEKVEIINFLPSYSTTKTIEKIKKSI